MNQFLAEFRTALRQHLFELAKIVLLDEVPRLLTSLQSVRKRCYPKIPLPALECPLSSLTYASVQ